MFTLCVCVCVFVCVHMLYTQVVSLLVPLRYDLHRLGGSWAQRQVFNLTMIQAAVNARDIPMAMALVAELMVRIESL